MCVNKVSVIHAWLTTGGTVSISCGSLKGWSHVLYHFTSLNPFNIFRKIQILADSCYSMVFKGRPFSNHTSSSAAALQ